MKPNVHRAVRLCALAAVAVLAAACASIGRPQGGPRDETSPVFVRSNPAPGAVNFDGSRIDIYFDENIQIKEVMDKVTVSPVQKQMPSINAGGHRLTVELRDTLLPNTTYTIDFSDAISDLNEGNPLEGFGIDFATGPERDSLVIAGMVLEARTLEPAQGMLVGVHNNLSDTALTTLPFLRIARTDQYGRFMVRGLAEGSYNVFAVNDVNRDNRWDRSENVAFLPLPVTPTVETIEVADTLAAAAGGDSIAVRQGVRYLPNDLLLTWFNEDYRAQYLRNNERPDSTKLRFEMGAPSDTFPIFTLLNSPAAGKRLDEVALLEHSGGRDSLLYWLTDPRVISTDTLSIEARYLRTDSADALSWTTDTLRLISRAKRPSPPKKKKIKEEEATDSTAAPAAPPTQFITFKPAGGGSQDLHRGIVLQASEPLAEVRQEMIRLEMLVDTVWTPAKMPPVARDSANRLLLYMTRPQWEESTRYRLTVDSAAVTGIYGLHNDSSVTELTTKSLEDYASLTMQLSGADGPMVVELLDGGDKPVARIAASESGAAEFTYLSPGTYYVRAFADRNANGAWDTGNVALDRQPEDTYYYPKKLDLKKNWEVTQTWDINAVAVDLQKPDAIKKNKPKLTGAKAKAAANTADNEEEEDTGYAPGFGSGQSTGRGSGNRGSSRTSGGLASPPRGF